MRQYTHALSRLPLLIHFGARCAAINREKQYFLRFNELHDLINILEASWYRMCACSHVRMRACIHARTRVCNERVRTGARACVRRCVHAVRACAYVLSRAVCSVGGWGCGGLRERVLVRVSMRVLVCLRVLVVRACVRVSMSA